MDGHPNQYEPRYFEELEVGERRTVEDARTITDADVVNFAGISGDFNPLHMSASYAEGTQFGERVVHGNLVFVITEGIVSEAFPKNPHGVASIGHDHLRFVEPVTIGDTLTVHKEVHEKEDHSEDAGRVVYRYETENQHGETVLVDDHISLVKKRSADE